MDMAPRGRFAYSVDEIFCNDKGFIMTGESLKYLCAVLNSSPITWMAERMALTTGMGLLQWKKFMVERIPIPQILTGQRRPLEELVDRILATKDAPPSANTEELEAEIDQLVYGLYGLTTEQITVVEERL